MNDKSKPLGGAKALPYRIQRTHLGEIEDDETLDSVMAMCDFGGGDYALKYIPPKLHIFRVIEREVS